MKSAIFITVRSDSSRLPQKALLPILGKPTIEMVILRAKLVRNADTVIVCTTERPLDDGIVEIASRCGVQHFRGSLEDKLDRWLGAARQFSIDCFVTADGDDLLCDPELMEAGLEQLKTTDVDFLEAPEGLICGAFTYGIRSGALEEVCRIKGTSDTEMMWVYFKDTGRYKVAALAVRDPVYFNPDIRMTLDYEEDLAFFQAIFDHYRCSKNDTPLRVIVPFLQEHPEIVQLNAFRHQDWARNQKLKTKLILKDAGRSEQ
jgi:spore coat polysaccharide biosynthesis protein SpsF